jgi:hypothetical protein
MSLMQRQQFPFHMSNIIACSVSNIGFVMEGRKFGIGLIYNGFMLIGNINMMMQ